MGGIAVDLVACGVGFSIRDCWAEAAATLVAVLGGGTALGGG